MKRDYANYQIGFKILLKKADKLLFLKSSAHNLWDFPGGRADNCEYETPLKNILNREVKEELGEKIKYKIGKPVFQCRRHNKKRGTHNLITFYEAGYLSGTIKLSPEHNTYQWINPKKYKLKKKDFYGKEEYFALKEYLNSL